MFYSFSIKCEKAEHQGCAYVKKKPDIERVKKEKLSCI
jgi:hypothetical protein